VQTCIWHSWCHCHSLSLASVKSRLVLPFCCRLTRIVPEKRPLNGCVCVCFCNYGEIIRLLFFCSWNLPHAKWFCFSRKGAVPISIRWFKWRDSTKVCCVVVFFVTEGHCCLRPRPTVCTAVLCVPLVKLVICCVWDVWLLLVDPLVQ